MRSLIAAIILLAAWGEAQVSGRQILVEEPTRTNRNVQVYMDSLTTLTPGFATTNSVRRAVATNSFGLVSSTLYPMLANWTERFSTNWSYTFVGIGGFTVDRFTSRDSLTSTVACAYANVVTTRVFTANLVSGIRSATAHNADLRWTAGTSGVDTTVSVYDNASFSWLSSRSGTVVVDNPRVVFSQTPLFARGLSKAIIAPGVLPLASCLSSVVSTNNTNTVLTLWIDAALPPISNYFNFGSQTYYANVTGGVYATYAGLHSTVLKAGPLLRISAQTGWYPSTGTNATWYVGAAPASKFNYSIMNGTNVVMTHAVSNGLYGAIETGPAFGILNTQTYIASTNVELKVLMDAVKLDRPMVVRVSIDLVQGMEACDGG